MEGMCSPAAFVIGRGGGAGRGTVGGGEWGVEGTENTNATRSRATTARPLRTQPFPSSRPEPEEKHESGHSSIALKTAMKSPLGESILCLLGNSRYGVNPGIRSGCR